VVSLRAPGSTLQGLYPANVIAPSYYTNSTNTSGAGYFRLSGTSMGACRFGRRGSHAAEKSLPDSGYREGASHEDGVQELPAGECSR